MANIAENMEEINFHLNGVRDQIEVVLLAGGDQNQLQQQHHLQLQLVRTHLRALQIPANVNFILNINANLLLLQDIFILLGIPEAIHDGSMSSTQVYVSLSGQDVVQEDVANMNDFEENLPHPVMPVTPEKTADDIDHERKI